MMATGDQDMAQGKENADLIIATIAAIVMDPVYSLAYNNCPGRKFALERELPLIESNDSWTDSLSSMKLVQNLMPNYR